MKQFTVLRKRGYWIAHIGDLFGPTWAIMSGNIDFQDMPRVNPYVFYEFYD